jgi:ribonuclease HI
MQKLYDLYQELTKDLNIEVRWIKAHCGVYGNEIVDKLASIALNSDMPTCNKITQQLIEFNFYNALKIDKVKLTEKFKHYANIN